MSVFNKMITLPLTQLNWYSVLTTTKRSISTIFALSSGIGKCGVAVIRISGPDAGSVIKKYGGFKELPTARKASLRRIRDPYKNEVLDQGLVLWFPGPKSFTGEDCCEFHVHGGTAIVSAILSSLNRFPNLRHAEPGEFTKRAFYAGKLDLTAVEGLNDLINAETEFQRKQALHQMEGSLYYIYDEWKNILTKCVSDIEVCIDFEEDQLVGDGLFIKTREVVMELNTKIKKHLIDGRRGERLRNGVNMAIIGSPNVGKSSLLNKLTCRPAAIVSSIAGTTRDLITIDLDVGGYPVVLTDTAGIRLDSGDQIEMEGVARAKAVATGADLILLVIDSVEFIHWSSEKSLDIQKNEFINVINDYLNSLQLNDFVFNCDKPKLSAEDINDSHEANRILFIFNKTDLLKESQLKFLKEMSNHYGITMCSISCRTDDGIESLVEKMVCHVDSLCGQPSMNSPSYSRTRHKLCLEECITALDTFLTYKNEHEIDLAGHYLKIALYNIGKITGHVSTEQILDKIFADFCIGK